MNRTGTYRSFGEDFNGFVEIPFEVALCWVKKEFPEETMNEPYEWLNKKWYLVKDDRKQKVVIINEDGIFKMFYSSRY